VTETARTAEQDAQQLKALGYTSHFDRTMSVWANFSLGFTYLSPVVGVYTLFSLSFSTGGPPIVWSYLWIGLAQLLVCLVFGEIVSQFPISGGLYPWARRLVGKRWAWMAGWVYAWALWVTVAAVATGGAPFFAQLIGVDISPAVTTAIAVAMIAVALMLNLSGTRLLSQVAMFGFVCELIGAIAVGIYLLLFARHQDWSALFDTRRVVPDGAYWPAFFVTLVIAMQSFWRLAAASDFESDLGPREKGFAAITRLIRHRPLWPAAAIYFLWNFGPGWGTPMFYHLTEHVGISSELFGTFTALQSLFFLPTTLLYGFLCTRAPLSRLLWWGTIVAILQGPIMFLAQGPASTIMVAILYGLSGGFATAAYIDLIMRSCPKGLEGTAMMMANTSMFAIAGTAGNLLGSWIYSTGGFASAVIITTLATALIVPVLRAVPPALTSTHDGELIDPTAGIE